MKFSTKEDLEIPITTVFEMLSDFDGFERTILRHGAQVRRTDDLVAPTAGMSWQARAEYRGRPRDIAVTLSEYTSPDMMRFVMGSDGIAGTFLIELVALSRARTRMRIELEIKPKTLSARLLMQSARLARNTLNRKYKTRIANFAEDMEERHIRGGTL